MYAKCLIQNQAHVDHLYNMSGWALTYYMEASR